MLIYPRQIRCIQISQNGTGSLPYRSFFVGETDAVKCKQNRLGGGDFEITVPYNQRNRELFNQIETVPTFILMSFFTEDPWDTEIISPVPHPMPMVVETYNETHDLLAEREEHKIIISGRGVIDVLLDNKVVMPKTTYRIPENEDQDDLDNAYPSWDIAVDLFGRNVNGDKLFDESGNSLTIFDSPSSQYLLSTESDPDKKKRYVPDVSLTSDVVWRTGDPRIERSYDGDNLLEAITSLVNISNLYITGTISTGVDGHLNFDYVIRRLTDLRANTATPLVYDYGAMPPRNYNKLLSTQELRQVVYAKLPPLDQETEGNYRTVTKGSQEENANYFGWVMKECSLDVSSLPLGETVDENYLRMLEMAAADELYKDGNVLIKIEDIEYLYSPMRYYQNCWPGCIYTSIGPDGVESSLLILSLVLTASKQEGWVVTPELAHYTDPWVET